MENVEHCLHIMALRSIALQYLAHWRPSFDMVMAFADPAIARINLCRLRICFVVAKCHSCPLEKIEGISNAANMTGVGLIQGLQSTQPCCRCLGLEPCVPLWSNQTSIKSAFDALPDGSPPLWLEEPDFVGIRLVPPALRTNDMHGNVLKTEHFHASAITCM